MNLPIVGDRHIDVAAGAKIFEFLVDDFHVRQALGSPECAHTHFPNVLKAQLQVRIHSLNVKPVAFFPNFSCCEHIRPSQEAVGSVYSLPDLILVVLDRPRYIPLAIHNIAQVGVLVGGVDFLALQGHISSQLPAYRHYPALGGIHNHFPSVRPFGNGIQCGL
ncbi:hypothetical protein AYI70_g6945 [Smittium culicis]|uniref:Uncharacterized protein n=1 Tax=Smittium culicis TaxID=133412 RepID=A0A1R1XMQ7_9FUNG|nr:hypothetical protein AYI70_g6945 [Smittium culicis]